jgi:primosomal protein N'
MGPAPAPIPKLRGSFRFQIQLQAPTGEPLRRIAQAATTRLKLPKDVICTVDVDPWEML